MSRLARRSAAAGMIAAGLLAATTPAFAASTKTCTTATSPGNGNSQSANFTSTNTQTSACNSNSDTGFVDQGTSNPGGNLPPGQQ